jgi:plastocyanin domain-containing protein
MTWDTLLVNLVGLALIAGIVWFFWLVKARGVRAPLTTGGYQEQMVLVRGGYTPDTIVVARGKPVRLRFVRKESSSCSEMVVLPAFDRAARLPEGAMVAVEFMPAEAGEYEFTCQMGMLRGRVVVEG